MKVFFYLKCILITEIKDENIGSSASESIISKIGPFQLRINWKIWNCGNIGDFNFIKSISQDDTLMIGFSFFCWPIILGEFAPDKLLQFKEKERVEGCINFCFA